jgi:hypothetical protein
VKRILICLAVGLLLAGCSKQPVSVVDTSESVKAPSPTPTPVPVPVKMAVNTTPTPDPWDSPEYKNLLKPQTKAQKEEEKKAAKKSSNQPGQYQAKDNGPHGPGNGVTKSGYYATVTKENLESVVRYAVQQDAGAIQEMLSEGRAILLKPEIRVHIDEAPFVEW